MEKNGSDVISERFQQIDMYSLLMDLLKNCWVIALCAVMVGVWGNLYGVYLSNQGNTYTSTTTLVVSSRGSESNVYSNLSAAQTLANSLSSIMESKPMQRRVCEDLGIEEFTAKVSGHVVSETNLMVLSVTDTSADKAYRVLKSVMSNYEELAETSLGNGTLVETLIEANVPKSGNKYVNLNYYTKRGAILGFLAGLALVIFFSIIKDTVKSSQDMSDRIDAKNLGVVYYEQKYKSLKAFFKHKKTSILVSNGTTSFSFVENYKKIAAKIAYAKKPDSGLSVVITSLVENEGKSTVSANLALTLANTGYNVCLIDCDLRKPAQDMVLFGKRVSKRKLEDYLNGTERLMDIIRYDKERNIFVILAGKEMETASELMSGDRMRNLIKTLKNNFDFVILDAPPLSSSADAESLADHSDTSVLVIRYNQVSAAEINEAIDLLNSSHAEVSGCILNRVHELGRGIAEVAGTYGYGHYGHYGHYGRYGRYGHYADRDNSNITGGEA